jgi:hypothetical protein
MSNGEEQNLRRADDHTKAMLATWATPLLIAALGGLAALQMKYVTGTLEKIQAAQETNQLEFSNRLARIEEELVHTNATETAVQQQLLQTQHDQQGLDRRITRLETMHRLPVAE